MVEYGGIRLKRFSYFERCFRRMVQHIVLKIFEAFGAILLQGVDAFFLSKVFYSCLQARNDFSTFFSYSFVRFWF